MKNLYPNETGDGDQYPCEVRPGYFEPEEKRDMWKEVHDLENRKFQQALEDHIRKENEGKLNYIEAVEQAKKFQTDEEKNRMQFVDLNAPETTTLRDATANQEAAQYAENLVKKAYEQGRKDERVRIFKLIEKAHYMVREAAGHLDDVLRG